jgi:dTDP-4-amino-4,6-dideoxygalactose transaminase
VTQVLHSGQYVLGPEVEGFEREFASFCGAAHGVGVASGTDALVLGLHALGVASGDHVVTSPFTFFASAAVIAWMGAKPVLADVDAATGLLDPASARDAIDERTTCIMPVHLYGQLADMTAFRSLADEKGLRLFEDGAQAHGATWNGQGCGTLGDAAAFSFYPTKNLGAAGEGGMVVTRDAETDARLRRLRDHGSPAKYVHAELGTNSRLHAIQAAVLRVKLPHLAAWNERRRALAARYDAAFEGAGNVRALRPAADAEHVYHQYAVCVRSQDDTSRARDAVREGLAARGIHAAVHYPAPVHTQEAARPWGYGPGDFPVAEALAREVLCLPVHPFLADADVDRVAESVLALAADAS